MTDVDGLVILFAWLELAALLLVLGWFLTRRTEDEPTEEAHRDTRS